MPDSHDPHKDASHDDADKLASGYERVLERLSVQDTSPGVKGFEEELDQALAAESEFRNYTKDEAALLHAWIRQDMEDMGHYLSQRGKTLANWLGIDLEAISAGIRDALFSIADKTQLQQQELNDQLEFARAKYHQGDLVAPGDFECVHCHAKQRLYRVGQLHACKECHHLAFQRAG